MHLLVLVVLSIALMVVDARFTLLKPLRSQMALVLMPSYTISDLPQRLWQGVASQFDSLLDIGFKVGSGGELTVDKDRLRAAIERRWSSILCSRATKGRPLTVS